MDDDREKTIEMQSKAFNKFSEGKVPVDLVKEGFCTSEEASALFREYGDSIGSGCLEILHEKMIEDLATQVGILGSRISRIELTLMNSLLLPKMRKCPSCDEKSEMGIGALCKKCGEVTPYFETGMDSVIPSHIYLEAYRPWDEDEEEE